MQVDAKENVEGLAIQLMADAPTFDVDDGPTIQPGPCFARDQIWVCQRPTGGKGWSDSEGCDVGCRVCLDDFGLIENMATRRHGKRWLLPNQGKQARDAHGLLHELRASQPRRVPLVIDYWRSPCWKNDGTECFDDDVDICDCYPGESGVIDPVTTRCEKGEATGDLLLGMFPDCNFYKGYVLPLASLQQIDCRLTDETGPVPVLLTSGRLFQGMFARMGETVTARIQCITNGFVECASSVPESICPSGFYWVDPENPPDYYNQDLATRNAMGFCLVTENSAQIRDNPLFPHRDRAVIAVKNAVLSVIGQVEFPDGNRLDQLDYRALAMLHGSGNSFVDYWERGAGTPEDMPCDDPAMIVAAAFPQSYMKHSRCPVQAELVVLGAQIELSLVAYKEEWSASSAGHGLPEERRVYPHKRVHISVRCGVRAWFPDGSCTLIRPWVPEGEAGHATDLAIVNPEGDCQALPTIAPALDEIVYVDAEGRKFLPPLSVHWWGYTGAFSDPPVADVWQDSTPCIPGSGFRPECLRLLQALRNERVGGWPYMGDSLPNDPNQVYGGSVTFDFRTDGYYALCAGR